MGVNRSRSQRSPLKPQNRTMIRVRKMSVGDVVPSPDPIADVGTAVAGLMALKTFKGKVARPTPMRMNTPPSSPPRANRAAPMKNVNRKRKIGPVHGNKAVPSNITTQTGERLTYTRRYDGYRYVVAKRRATGNKFARGTRINVWVPRRKDERKIEGGNIHFWRVQHYQGPPNKPSKLIKTQSNDRYPLEPTGDKDDKFVRLSGSIPSDIFSGSRWGSKCARGPRFFMGVIQVDPSGEKYTTIPYHTEISHTSKESRYRDPVLTYGEETLFNMVELARRGDARPQTRE